MRGVKSKKEERWESWVGEEEREKKEGEGRRKKNNFSLIRFAMERKKRLDGNQEGISF